MHKPDSSHILFEVVNENYPHISSMSTIPLYFLGRDFKELFLCRMCSYIWSVLIGREHCIMQNFHVKIFKKD